MPLTANKLFKINVSNDQLMATLTVNGETPPGALPAEQIETEIADIGIVVDEQGKKDIAEYALALAESRIPEAIVVARGAAPVHDQNGTIVKLFEISLEEETAETDKPGGDDEKPTTETGKASDGNENRDADDAEEPTECENDAQSHYDRCKFIFVREGQEIIRLAPPVTGEDGVDVFGKPIPRKLGRDATIRLGPNVAQQDDLVIAKSNGKVECTIDKVWVDDKLVIDQHVDFSVGNIDFEGELSASIYDFPTG